MLVTLDHNCKILLRQLIQRDERAAIRHIGKEEREYKLKVETSKLEKEKADALLAVEQQKLDAEIKLKKKRK